ncbi:hypothetical protein FGO68_gene5828 [Halteria grandinella]|uniref:Uncharacterized protein n=1 Tax=Halteria grandinella TaxID=5974 RepID=A0A8J8NUY1_HALGN|nr:hypothetical protein FGO68_gene5828 [Halteria grandinella]
MNHFKQSLQTKSICQIKVVCIYRANSPDQQMCNQTTVFWIFIKFLISTLHSLAKLSVHQSLMVMNPMQIN